MQRFDGVLHLISRKRVPDSSDLSPDSGAASGSGTQARYLELVMACRKGDQLAQKKLYDLLSGKMFALCLRYMGDRTQAEDILQDGFITLFTKLASFTGGGSFEGWARKIFVNTALMSLRKNDALKMSDSLEPDTPIKAETTTQLENIGYKELLSMISSMPDGYRTVFNMYVIEGYSHKEIAEALGISEATSRSQLQRARVLLQNKLKKA